MTILLLALLAAQSSATVLPYPGVWARGEIGLIDGRSCSLFLWDGAAVAASLLDTNEREVLAQLRKEIAQQWQEGDRPAQAGLLRRYLDLMQPPNQRTFAPLTLRNLAFQHLRVICGETVVRSGFVLFPHTAGYALVAYYAPTNADLVLVDYAPKAKEVAEDATAFVEAYRAELGRASSEEELPRAVRDALAEHKKGQQRLEKGRIRFADFNGIYLPGCPGQCPPKTLADAWSRLAAEERLAFAPLLGLLARVGANPGELSGGPGLVLFGTEAAWPEEFGDNPVRPLEGRLARLTPGPLPRTFTRPDAAVALDLFGGEDWEPPSFDGQLNDVIKAMRRALR